MNGGTLHRDMFANVVGATRLAGAGTASPPALLLQELEPHQLCPERLLHLSQLGKTGLQLGNGPFKEQQVSTYITNVGRH